MHSLMVSQFLSYIVPFTASSVSTIGPTTPTSPTEEPATPTTTTEEPTTPTTRPGKKYSILKKRAVNNLITLTMKFN